MFDIGSSELLLTIIVAIVVIGPKDLPRALYKVGQVVGKARAMSRHFRAGIDEMAGSRFCSIRNCQPSFTGIIRSSRIRSGAGALLK